MAMNLGLGIEKAVNPGGGAETVAAPATPSTGATQAAGAVFGQLMAKALQQQAKGRGQAQAAGAAETTAASTDATSLLAVLGQDTQTAAGESSELDPQAAGDSANAQAQALQGLPVWLQPLNGMPAIQHIQVGPSLQAITAASQTPNPSSLTAFAHQQGLDAAAIAWLMNPTADAAGELPQAGTAQALASTASLAPKVQSLASTSPLQVGLPSAPTPHLQASAASTGLGLEPELSPARALSPTAAPTAALTATSTVALTPAATTMAMPLGIAVGPKPWSAASPLPAPMTADPGATPSSSSASAGAAPVASLTLSTPTTADSPPALALNPGDSHALRWSQAMAHAGASTQHPVSAASANADLPATSTAWAEWTLDLSQDMGDSSATQDQGGQTGQGSAASSPAPSPLTVDNQGLQRTPAQAFQARLTAQLTQTGPMGAGSDQMQQLSEKMADAIGQRMLRELEKGQLNLRLSLKPAQLGHIEVEMQLRAGQLDATFAAPQAATRELLQDGLARLRDSLAQAGMDVANLNVKNGQNRQNGGDSTPGRGKFAQKDKASEAADPAVATVESKPRPRRSDGWDVMV